MIRNRMQRRVLLLAIIEHRQRQRDREQGRRPRRWWQKLWVERRRDYSQYYNLFEILDRQFQGDYQAYMRLDRDLFGEVLRRVGPRITKSQRYVKYVFCISMGLGGYQIADNI